MIEQSRVPPPPFICDHCCYSNITGRSLLCQVNRQVFGDEHQLDLLVSSYACARLRNPISNCVEPLST